VVLQLEDNVKENVKPPRGTNKDHKSNVPNSSSRETIEKMKIEFSFLVSFVSGIRNLYLSIVYK
jgi:hypothetical protein